MVKQMPEWAQLGTGGQKAKTAVAILKEVGTALPLRETIDWIGYPVLPEQVLVAIQLILVSLVPEWSPTPPTEIM